MSIFDDARKKATELYGSTQRTETKSADKKLGSYASSQAAGSQEINFTAVRKRAAAKYGSSAPKKETSPTVQTARRVMGQGGAFVPGFSSKGTVSSPVGRVDAEDLRAEVRRRTQTGAGVPASQVDERSRIRAAALKAGTAAVEEESTPKPWDEGTGSLAQVQDKLSTGNAGVGMILNPVPTSSASIAEGIKKAEARQREIIGRYSEAQGESRMGVTPMTADEDARLNEELAQLKTELARDNERWNLAKATENEDLRKQGWRDADLKDLTLGSLSRGFTNAQYGLESFKSILGQKNDAQKYSERLEGDDYKFITDAWWEDAISGAAEQLGQQGKQLLNTDTVALMGAGTIGGAIIGAPFGGVGTVPGALGGMATGFKAGSMAANFKIEAGQAYNEMMANGIEPETAKTIAMIVGGANSGLEFMQADELVKSLKIMEDSGLNAGAERVRKYLTDYALGLGNEVLQEVAQEGVTIAGSQAAQKYQTGDWAYSSDEVMGRLGETAASSALTFGALGIPGAVRNITHIATEGRTNTQIGAQIRESDAVQSVIDEGLQSDTKTDSYKWAAKLQEKADQGQKVSDEELGYLYKANVEAVAKEERMARVTYGEDGKTAEERTQADVSGILQEAAEQVAQSGTVTNRVAERILSEQEAVDALGVTISPSMSMSQQRTAVKEAAKTLASSNVKVLEETGEVAPSNQTAVQRIDNRAQARPVAQRAYDIKRMQRAAASLGENGAKALAASYDGSGSADTYYAGFSAYYEAGVSGLDAGKVQSSYAQQLNEAQKFAAYAAGQNDAAASLVQEQRKAQFAQVAGEDSGLVFDDYVASTMDSATADRVNTVSKLLGVRVRFVDNVRGGTANAQISGTDVLVEKGNRNPVMFLLGHEWTHRLQETAPNEYRAFRDAVAEEAQVEAGVLLEQYRANGENITYEAALDEAAANYAGRMIEDGKVLDAFIEKHKDNRTMLEKVREAIRTLVRKLTGEEKRQAQTVEGKLTAALEASAKQTKALEAQKNTAMEGGEVRLSIKYDQNNTPYVVIENDVLAGVPKSEWVKAVKDNLREKFPDGVTVGNNVVSVNKQSRREMTFSKYMQRLFSTEPGLYADKLRATDNADEILMAAQNWVNEALLHPRKDDIIDFARGKVLLRIGASDYSAQVIVGNRGENGLLLYDIINLSPATIQERIKKSDAVYTANATNGPRSRGPASDTTSISKSDGKSNTKFSMKSPVEETRDLLALHNLTERNLRDALALGGMPMPSIAIVKAQQGHTKYGPISMVFSKETVDPKVSSKNRVYGGDAYTATAPRVDRIVNRDVQRRFSKEISDLAKRVVGGMFSGEASAVLSFDDSYTRDTMDDIMDSLARNYGVMAAYLADQGKSLDPVMKERANEYDSFGNEALSSLKESVGEQGLSAMFARVDSGNDLTDADMDAVRTAIRGALERRGGGFSTTPEQQARRIELRIGKLTTERMAEFVRNAWYLHEDGMPSTEQEVDRYATMDALREVAPEEAVRDWVRPQLDGLLGEAGIYNGKDPFTPSGNRKGFSALHNPYTLENIVKAMTSQQSERGEGTWGVTAKTLQSVATPSYQSVRDIKADSSRLGAVEGDAYEAQVKAVDQRVSNILQKVKDGNKAHSENPFKASDIIGDVLMTAAKGTKTVDAIVRTFSREGYTISAQTAQDIQTVFKAAAELPTEYFEAKPRRAVGFDEVLAAVVPDDMDTDLRTQAEKAGMRVLEYKVGDDADRLRAVNSVEGAQFSLKGSENARDIARLEERTEWLREQMKVSTVIKTDKNATGRLASSILKEYASSYDQQGLTTRLRALYDFIANGKDSAGNEMSWGPVHQEAMAIARDILDGSIQQDNSMYDDYSELRSYLRTTKLNVPRTLWGEFENAGGYSAFRKRNFGRLDLSATEGRSIDSAYKELSELWPEFFDEGRASHPADQLLQIADVLDHLRPIWENPYTDDMGMAAEYLADDIIESFYDVPQQRPTFADRQAAKLNAAKANGKQQVQAVREQKNARIDEIKRHGREKVQEAIKRERSVRNQKMQSLKEHYQGRETAGRERRSAAELRRKITRHASSLSQKLLRPSDKQHIPEGLRAPVAALLEAINLESTYAVDPETGKRVKNGAGLPARRTEAFRALRDAYRQVLQGGEGLVLDPDLLGDEVTLGNLDAVIEMKDTRIADMGSSQLETVWNTLRAVEASISTANKTLAKSKYKTISEMGDAMRNDFIMTKPFQERYGPLGMLHKLVNIEMLAPVDYFKELGRAGDAMWGELRSGLDQKVRDTKAISDYAAELIGKTDIREWSGKKAELHTFSLEDGDIQLTTAQIMSLYMLMQRKQAQEHVLKGGIRQAPVLRQGKVVKSYAPVRVSLEGLQDIVDTLTDEQCRIADGLGRFMNTTLSDWGNEVSMAMYGYKKFNEEHYFPIKSDENYVKTEFAAGQDQRVKNLGFTKATVPHANNAIMVEDIFDVFTRHADDMSTYHAFAAALEDVERVYNYRYRTDTGEVRGSVSQTIERVLGKDGKQYFRTLMKNLNEGIRKDDSGAISRALVSNYKAAAVGANLRVIVQQPTAIFRAAAVMDPKYLVASMAKKGNFELVKKWAPIAQWKDWGYFQLDTGRQMKDIMLGTDSKMDKMREAMMQPAGWADNITWSRLWNACELEVADKRPSLERGSDAFYQAVAERFGEIVDRTQVVDSVLHRSQSMRSGDLLVSMATSFMSEPTKTYNLFRTAAREALTSGTKESRAKLARVTVALLVTGVVNAAAAALIDALRDDDDDEDYGEKFMQAVTGLEGDEETMGDYIGGILGGNLGDNLNPLGMVPYGKDILSIWQGYGVDRMDMTAIADLKDAADRFMQAVTGDGKQTVGYAISDLAGRSAKLLGLPLANVKRDLEGIVNGAFMALEAAGVDVNGARFAWAKLKTPINDKNKNYWIDMGYRFEREGDGETAGEIYDALTGVGIPADKIEARKRTVLKKSDVFSSRKEDVRNDVSADLESSRGYRQLTDEQQEKALDAAETYAYVTAMLEQDPEYTVPDTYNWVLKANAGKAVGVEPFEYILFDLAYDMAESEKDENGKTVAGSKQEKVIEALDDMSWLSDRERDYLYGTRYSSDKNNPYK